MASRKYVSPKGFEDVHPILGESMRAAPRQAWPARPHLGGPMPDLTGYAQLAVGLWAAEQARTAVPDGDREKYDAALAMTRRWFGPGDERPSYRELWDAADAAEAKHRVTQIGRMVVAGARSLAKGGSTVADVNKFSREAAARVVEAAGVDAKTFLAALDQRIMICELAAMHEERGVKPSSPATAILARPKGKTKRVPPLVLARLESGRFGLWHKVGTRWAWSEGSRDEMLATVPDAFMEAATRGVLG
jgi:hypothetical protein